MLTFKTNQEDQYNVSGIICKEDNQIKTLLDTEKIGEVKKIARHYLSLYDQLGTDKEIIDCYLLNKPMTFIECYHKNKSDIDKLGIDLKKYFFVVVRKIGRHDFFIYITRFRNIYELIKSSKYLHCHPDLMGLLCGYKTKDIAYYLVKNKEQKIIKR